MTGTDNLKRKTPKISLLNKWKRFASSRRLQAACFFCFLKKM